MITCTFLKRASCARASCGVFPGAAALALLLAGSWATQSRAQSASPPLGKSSGKEYVLLHPSTFEAPPTGQRNPFWPIGWVPTASLPTATAAALDVRAEQFVVTAISVDYPPLAVINGKTRGVGDQISVSAADPKQFVTVRKIADGMVSLDYRGHELVTKPAGDPPLAHPAPPK